MKPVITGFLNLEKRETFKEQIATAKKLNINSICLKEFNQRPIIELNDAELKEINLLLKTEKMKVDILDTNIKPYDINSDAKHKEALAEFKSMINIAKKLKVKHLYYRLPLFTDVIEEYENIRIRLEPFIDLAMKNNKKIILYPVNGYKTNVYAYIFKKIKANVLSVLFDPVYIMLNDESTTTAYRLLKRKIGAFATIDADHKDMPKLMGYGETNVLAILKKMIRDRYTGFLIIDTKFEQKTKELESKNKGLIAKVFRRKEKKKRAMMEEVSESIFSDEQTKNATYHDILVNQINVLKIIFK